MPKVINIHYKDEYEVFNVREFDGEYQFFIYRTGKWQWVDASDYKPAS